MAVPFYYIHRNLRARRVTTLLTIGGMALVVFVFATMRMLAEGIKQTLVDTGRGDNVMVIRRSAETEVQSSVDREQAAIVESLPHIARGPTGESFASKETLVLLVLAKRGSGKPSNVTIRGLSTPGLGLRPQVRVAQGRMFRPGTSEIIAGVKIAQSFSGTGLGERIRLGGREWTVVGLFDAGNSGFGSEILGRCRSVDAGVSPQRILLGDFPAGRPAFLCIRTAKDQQRPALDARSQAGDRVLCRPVGGNVEFLKYLRDHAEHHVCDRRRARSDDHHVPVSYTHLTLPTTPYV